MSWFSCIQKASGLNISRISGHPDWNFCAFSHSFQVNAGKVSQLGSERFILSHSQFLLLLAQQPQCTRISSFLRFLAHTQRHTTHGRTPLDECSGRHRDLYLTTHNTHRWTSMPPAVFEPSSPASSATHNVCPINYRSWFIQ